MNAASWIWTNKEWLFSGGGVVIIAALLTWWRQRTDKRNEAASTTAAELYFTNPAGEPPSPHWFWKMLEKVPGFRALAWRHIYTEQEIGRRIRILVQSDGEGIALWRMGEDGSARVWLDIVNLNPFPLEIDRITGDLTVAGTAVAPVSNVDKHEIPAVGWKTIHFQSPLTAAQVAAIEFQLRQRSDAVAGLQVRIYFESEVRKVTLFRQPASGNCRFPNFQAKQPPVRAT